MATGHGLISFWLLEFNEERSNPTICFVKFTSVKVSNNALNFLLAQYRAIFKRAYVKGLASAVLLTAGLAAGAASSPAMAAEIGPILGQEDFVSGGALNSGTITQDSTLNMSQITDNQVSGGYLTFIGDTTIKGQGVDVVINGAFNRQISFSGTNQSLTVENGATLTIYNNGTANTNIRGGSDGASGTLTIQGANSALTLNSSDANFNKVNVTSGATLTLGGMEYYADHGTNADWTYFSNVYANNSSESGTVTVDAGTVNLNDQSLLGADHAMNISGSTINFAGKEHKVESGDAYATAFIRVGNTGSLTIAGKEVSGETQKSTLDVADGAWGAIYANTVSIADTNVKIGSGATFILDGNFQDRTKANEGVHSGTTLTLDDVTFDNQGTAIIGNPTSGGTATIQSGTTTLTGAVKNYAKVTVKGTSDTSGSATLVVSADQLTKTAGSGEGWFAGHSGSITLSGAAPDTAILQIDSIDADGLNLNTDLTITSGSADLALGEIGISGNGTIKGERLVLAEAINVGTGNNLKLSATNLTLGSSTYTGTASMGISGATARNLTLQGSGNSFTLADAVTMSAIDEVDNPFLTEEGKLKVAADGQLNLEDKTTITGTNGLTIAAGNYESNANVTLSGGKLTVGGQTGAAEGVGVDASLALTGKLTLDNSTNANTITIAGNGDLTIDTDNGVTVDNRAATSTLDLTGVRDITITGHASNLNKFEVNKGGELLLSTNAFNSIMNLEDKPRTNSGSEIVVSGGGYVYVEGSVQGGTGNQALDVAKLTSGSTAGTDQIRFSGDGTLEARDTIWLADTNGSSTLNIGSGELKAQTFRLDGFGTTADNKTTYAPFKVESGILTAGARVESSHDNDIQLGNGTDSGATLNLGYIEANLDQWGQETGTFTTSSATGSVDTNLVLSGAAGSKSALNVVYGDWTAKDIAVTNGTVTVGDITARTDADDNEVVYNASLTGNKLTLGTGAEATVNSNGKATFNELTMTAGTLTVNGEMTVNGNHVPANNETSTPESWGVNLAAGSTIDVTGRNARLTFGGDAVSAISIDSDNKGVTVQTGTFGKTIDVKGFATLGLNFAEGTTFNADTLQSLRTALLSNSTNGAALTEGYINLGAARIEGVTVSPEGTIDWNQLKDFADIDQLQDIITDDMSNATLVNANGTDTIQGNVGNIQLDGNQQTVQLGDVYLANSSSNNENGNFIFNETNPAQAGNANIVGGAHVTFANGGNVGAVSLATGTANGGETIFNVVSQDPAAETNITSISAGDNTLVNISAITNVAQNVNADAMQVDSALNVTGNVDLGSLSDSFDTTGAANGTLTAANLSVDGVTAYHGNLDIAGNADFAGETYLGGNNKFATRVTFGDYTELDHGTTEAGRVVLNGAAASLDIIGDAVLNAQVVDAAAGQTIHVGEESSTDVGYTGDEPWESSAGYFFAERVDLNGATIMADPAFGKAASMVGIGQLGDTAAITNGNDAGTLNGQVIALRNAIMAIGVSDTEEATVREQLQGTFAQYLDANGSLDADGVGSILYVAEALNVDNNSKLIVDSKRSFTTYANDSAQKATGAYGDKIDNNDVYIGENSALALGEAAALTATYNNAPRAALDFDKNGASLYAEKNAKILLVGSDFSIHSDIHLFSDNDGNGIMINGNNVTVSTMNNLLIDTLEQGKEAGSIKLSLNRDAVGSAFYAASTPVKNTLIAYAANDLNWADTSDKHVTQQLLGDRVANVTWDGTNFKIKEGDTERVLSAEESADLTRDVVGYDEKNQPIIGVFKKGYNYFLDQVARDSKSGSEAETVARLGVYGGAPQAAIKAGQSSTDAIAARFGIGSAISNLTVAGNTQGAALWLAPVYKTSDSDGFDAQGVDYGVNVDLYGVALGADYTLANGISFGAMFNVGSGEVDGEGAASPVSNDFDYYGFGAYAGYTMGQFSVVGDVSYTVADNEVEASTSVDHIGAQMDSTNLSLGVTGKYELSFNGINVTPHVGLRYSNIDLDDYTIDGEDVIASADSDKLNLFSIPVGVTIAKEFKGESWTVAPSFDLTLTGQFGDDELDGSVNWAGISNMTTDTTTEVFDNFTYGATLGVEAQSVGGIALGINVGYTGSSNVDEFGVKANARFTF